MNDDSARGWREALEAIPQIVWTADPSGRTEWFNARWYDYTGQNVAQALAGGYAAAIHPADLVVVREAFAHAIETGDPLANEHRLRAADGSYRWHLGTARPLHEAGQIARWIGVSTDVDERRRSADAMAFLADAAEALGNAIDLDAALAALAKLVVPTLADWCSVYLLRDGELVPHTVHHRDPVKRAFAWDILRRYPLRPEQSHALRTGEPLYIPVATPQMLAPWIIDEQHAAAIASLGFNSVLAVPLAARGGTLGIMQLLREPHRDPFAPADRDLAVVLAQRAAVVLDNARATERERRIAHTFQEAALPRALPRIDGLRLDVVYVASERDAGIGGDWYDAFVLRDGKLVVSIGDVAGKGVDAAVLMSSLRQAVRVAAYQGLDPAAVLAATDEALSNERPDRIATAFVGILDPATWTLVYASAGHPPALLRSPGGALLTLTTSGPPLGLRAPNHVVRTIAAIPPGSVLVTYTDGLTEATQNVLEGERRLNDVLSDDAVVYSANPARFVRDAVLRENARDDVAILVVGFGRDAHWSFDAEDAMAAHGARSSFVQYLAAGADEGDLAAAELIFGELVGNVVRYAPGPIDVGLEWNDERPTLHVLDRGPSFDLAAALPTDMLSETGRGLFIVDALGEGLAVNAVPGRGNHVRVMLPIRRKRR
ncbi:MAG: SpoIIE family protein phosphatase [Candidatus Eremiobacteraeota bacterium]|nr:SpoIIE family protein phosphatase [Candidatus Eremiobacteraeota bacterium]